MSSKDAIPPVRTEHDQLVPLLAMTIPVRTPVREDEDFHLHLELWNACRSRLCNSKPPHSSTIMCDPEIPLLTSSEDDLGPVWTSEDEASEESQSKSSRFL